MQDNYRHKGMRKRLVDSLREKGISNELVLAAINAIPRHFFMEKAFEEIAYQDRAFPIGFEQTISQPYTVAYQTSLLELSPKDKILEIGTGSGFQSAVLAVMGARVFTIERQEGLYNQAKEMFEFLKLKNSIRSYFKDGYKGLPEYAPFDKILVTCGAPDVPLALAKQLAIGGKMVIPVGVGNSQKMLTLTRKSEDEFIKQEFDDFRFVPFLPGKKLI
jgi:protein-L-isoaspartate(D-aspartate) O-methyltransferase